MDKLLEYRHSLISVFAIACLTYLGVSRGIDVSIAIAGVVAALSGTSSYEEAAKHKVNKLADKTGGVDNAG